LWLTAKLCQTADYNRKALLNQDLRIGWDSETSGSKWQVLHDSSCHIDSDLQPPGSLGSVPLYLLSLLSLLFPHPNGNRDKLYRG
jgi:hypothetical protein